MKSVLFASLVVVAMNAASGTIAYARQGRVDVRSGVAFAIATLPGSVAGALLTRGISRGAFDAIFAALLVGLAVFLGELGLLYGLLRRKEAADVPDDITPPVANVVDPNYTFLTKVKKEYLPRVEAYGGVHARLRDVAASYRG